MSTLFNEINFSSGNQNIPGKNNEGFISRQNPSLDDVIQQMKNHIKFNIQNGLYSNALFFADKVMIVHYYSALLFDSE